MRYFCENYVMYCFLVSRFILSSALSQGADGAVFPCRAYAFRYPKAAKFFSKRAGGEGILAGEESKKDGFFLVS